MTTTAAPAPAVYVPTYAHKQLRSWLKRWDRWSGLCDTLSAAERAYEADPSLTNEATMLAAVSAWRKGLRSMPSKASKHQAYSNADSVRRYLNEHRGLSIERGSNVDYLRTVAAFTL